MMKDIQVKQIMLTCKVFEYKTYTKLL